MPKQTKPMFPLSANRDFARKVLRAGTPDDVIETVAKKITRRMARYRMRRG